MLCDVGGILFASVGGKAFAEVQPFTCNQLAYHTHLCRDVPGSVLRSWLGAGKQVDLCKWCACQSISCTST